MQNAVLGAYKALCRQIGSPYAKKCLTALASNGVDGVGDCTIDPSTYRNPYNFALDFALSTYLSKFEGGADEKNLRVQCASDFKESEFHNALTNAFLRCHQSSLAPVWKTHSGISMEGIILTARRIIGDVLGDYAPRRWVEHCEWGPGSTATIRLADATPDNKVLETALSVTPRGLAYARAYLETDWSWMSARCGVPVEGPFCALASNFNIIENSLFDSVEKTRLKRRAIDKQPTMNVFLQKGLAKPVRRALKRFGIDLDDQRLNQRMARAAQAVGLATIDLRNASGSICTELVRLLIADDGWFGAFNDLRTTHSDVNGELIKLHGFSGMGNGYTFELETLLFYGLARAVEISNNSSSMVSVYGDDIITWASDAPLLYEVFSELGLTVNPDKSFIQGPFFESCGGQYFDGQDVTPLYQKSVICSQYDAIAAHNRLIRWGRRMAKLHGHEEGIDEIVKHPANEYRRPYSFKPLQPLWLDGDAGYIHLQGFVPDKHGSLQLVGYMSRARSKLGKQYALLATWFRRQRASQAFWIDRDVLATSSVTNRSCETVTLTCYWVSSRDSGLGYFV